MEVVLTESAAQDLEALPVPIHARLLRILERLARWPDVSGARALSGKLAGRWRMRTGDYRIQFHVEGQRIIVERIGHRDRFYDR